MANSQELKQLLDLLSAKAPLTAMLAPSFPIDFSYPEIIGKIKRAGFAYVVEVARGATDTNKQVIEELKQDPLKRVITSPCPSFVGFLRAKYPEYSVYLSKADSPMRATAKLVKEKFSDTKPVFIGPCITKKIETKEYASLDILAITFKELNQLFAELNIQNEVADLSARFDIIDPQTELYPISGGLCQSAGINEYLTNGEYRMVSGINNLDEAIKEFINNKTIRLLDVLFCDGGCISGPGIINQKPISQRRQAVINFWSSHLKK